MHYLQGLLMGLAYVAPIGVQNLFVINTALTQPRKRAVLTALIVVFFDVSLAFACFFGVGAIMERIPVLRQVILLAGSLIVFWIGLGLVRSKGGMDPSAQVDLSLPQVAAKACVVTWFNPQAIIDGTMLFGAFRASLPAAYGIQFILGVASASFLWFNGVTLAISLFSARFNDKILRVINVVCGCVILFYAVRLFLTFLQGL